MPLGDLICFYFFVFFVLRCAGTDSATFMIVTLDADVL